MNNPTLGVQYAICLHHKSRSSLLCIQRVFNLKYKPFAFRALNSLNIEQPFSEDSENHATSHVNLEITKSQSSHLQALPTDLGLHYQCIIPIVSWHLVKEAAFVEDSLTFLGRTVLNFEFIRQCNSFQPIFKVQQQHTSNLLLLINRCSHFHALSI